MDGRRGRICGSIVQSAMADMSVFFASSSARFARALRPDPVSRHGDVDRRRAVDLRHDYKLYDVLPRGTGVLGRTEGWWD